MPISNPFPAVYIPEPEVLTAVHPPTEKEITTTASLIVPINSARRGLTIVNGHANPVYFDVKNSLSSTSYMFRLEAGALYEMPSPAFADEIFALSSFGTGKLYIREIVVL